ncbi:BolA family transcriptional regulator [Pendulispora brunnea]|uniref:BolA family transcriptional regulator n=1 Tax=Pendulispora brunnea TaxID=2905690 RepID=A0ABZ2KPI2_9BACT
MAMGRMADRIREKLRDNLAPSVLDVIDESRMHSVPKDAETHFKVVIVSQAFDGLGRVERHQTVYRILKDELAQGVHALSIISKSPAEWEKEAAVPASPPCLGGSKSGGN